MTKEEKEKMQREKLNERFKNRPLPVDSPDVDIMSEGWEEDAGE